MTERINLNLMGRIEEIGYLLLNQREAIERGLREPSMAGALRDSLILEQVYLRGMSDVEQCLSADGGDPVNLAKRITEARIGFMQGKSKDCFGASLLIGENSQETDLEGKNNNG